MFQDRFHDRLKGEKKLTTYSRGSPGPPHRNRTLLMKSTSLVTKSLLALSLLLFPATNAMTQDEALGLHSDGGSWKFYPAQSIDDTLPNVLLIGDSILGGYRSHVIKGLKENANVDYWLTPVHLKSPSLLEDLSKVVTYRKYDVIHFNIGLHGWPEGRITPEEYPKLLSAYVASLKENAPDASLIWGSTTPVHESGTTKLHKEINPTIVRRNKVANDVMKRADVAVNDLYALMVGKLNFVRGDRFHWKRQAYQIMAKQIIARIQDRLPELSAQEE